MTIDTIIANSLQNPINKTMDFRFSLITNVIIMIMVK